MSNMQKIVSDPKHSSLRITPQQSLRHLGICSQISTGQQTSPIVFPEKRGRGKNLTRANISDKIKKRTTEDHKIDIGDEKSDLLGYDVLAGKLILDKRKTSKIDDPSPATETSGGEAVDAKLTSKALIWGTELLSLEDVISVSYYSGLRHFTVHSYPYKKVSSRLSCFVKKGRSRQDFRFLASTSEEAIHWVSGFADQQCYVNCLPHPLKQASDLLANEFPPESYIKCKSPPKMLVILNPRSGRGRSSKAYHGFVEPILKCIKELPYLEFVQLVEHLDFSSVCTLRSYTMLAGFQLEVVKTNSAGHARTLASSVDFSSCPDGIICVGGDGLVNEVLNGLLSRSNQKEAISIPIGIIPAGSDNSLVWTVLGVQDPISAAVCIVKGGLTATDVFAVEWIKSGVIHFGTTVTYFGFIGDVLELSERYQKRFGPLRYFVAGFLKFLCLPKYTYEVEYLAALSKEATGEEKGLSDGEIIDMADLYTDIMRRSSKEGLTRASSLSSIDSIMTPSQTSGADVDTTCSSTEPSEYVRAINAKSKRLSIERTNTTSEPEVIHPQVPFSTTKNWPRTRSKSRSEKGWAGLTINDPLRSSWTNTNDREDISSTVSDPGPIWDAEPKWDTEQHTQDIENPLDFPRISDDVGPTVNTENDAPLPEDYWVTVKKGHVLGVFVCNHSCRTVQSLSSQVLSPKAEHDDKNLDLLLVHGSGRFRLLRFFLLLQMGRHLSLPYVEYVKVKSVKVKPGKHSHNGCGIDGELFPVNGQVICSLLQDQCRLIGRSL